MLNFKLKSFHLSTFFNIILEVFGFFILKEQSQFSVCLRLSHNHIHVKYNKYIRYKWISKAQISFHFDYCKKKLNNLIIIFKEGNNQKKMKKCIAKFHLEILFNIDNSRFSLSLKLFGYCIVLFNKKFHRGLITYIFEIMQFHKI